MPRLSPQRPAAPLPLRHLHNPRAERSEAYPTLLEDLLSEAESVRARATLRGWPEYAPTPLHSLPHIAAELRLGEVRCKDESLRFGLGSFKALGGAYAVHRVAEAPLAAGERPESITVCTASAGNHGLSVAWGARTLGCRCVIFLPEGTGPGRAQRIAAMGAEVRLVPGRYDDAVRRCAEEATKRGWLEISDTAREGYMRIPGVVMQGYTLLAEEVLAQWDEGPTHVFLQCGVGGLAAAVCAHLWRHARGGRRPVCVVVEPDAAACMQVAVGTGRPTPVDGSLATEMSCLACAEVSRSAWEILARGAQHLITIADGEAERAVVQLAHLDPPIRSAPSGAAGFAGLLRASLDSQLRASLRLSPDSRVLVINSEGPQA